MSNLEELKERIFESDNKACFIERDEIFGCMLEGGKPYDIPDFTKEEDCKLYENDRLSPFYGVDGSDPVIPCCSHTDFKPTEEQIENYKKALGLK